MWRVVDQDNVEQKIIYAKKQGKGDSLNIEIKAIPLFFDVLLTNRIYERYDEHMTAAVAFQKVFDDTGYTFALVDSFLSVQWEGFGDGETKMETFKRCLDRYKCEFRIVGDVVYLHKLIGRDTSIQYRHKLNASNIVMEIDAQNMWTYAKGYGDYGDGDGGEDWQDAKLKPGDSPGNPYTSPLAAIIGIRHAPPIKNGNITDAETLDNALKELVNESLKISVSADIHDLRKQGYPIAQSEVGDRVFLIDERIGLDDEVRIVNQSITRDWQGNILDFNVTFGSEGISKRHQSNINTGIKNIQDILDGKVTLPYDVLDEAVKRATEALKSAQTELIFENGIIAVEKGNPNNIVLFNSNGLGVSRDGGESFRQAITHLGINTDLLTAGSIHTNNIQIIGDSDYFYWDGNALMAISKNDVNKYVKLNSDGLYIAKGALTIERPDGALWIADGVPKFDFGIQSSDPPFTSPDIEVVAQWYTTNQTTDTVCQLYTFKHESRYLKFNIAHKMHYTATTTSGRVTLRGIGNMAGKINVGKTFTNTDEGDGTAYDILVVDLGIPTYDVGSFYLELRTGASGFPAQVRKLRAWLEG